MTRACSCPPGSAFHWHENPRKSIFLGGNYFIYGANAGGLGRRETSVETKQRIEREIGHALSNVIDGEVVRRARR